MSKYALTWERPAQAEKGPKAVKMGRSNGSMPQRLQFAFLNMCSFCHSYEIIEQTRIAGPGIGPGGAKPGKTGQNWVKPGETGQKYFCERQNDRQGKQDALSKRFIVSQSNDRIFMLLHNRRGCRMIPLKWTNPG
jgi:hypothetical protein